MTATYLPMGFERIAAWSESGSTGWPHTIRIVNPTTNAEFVVHRGTPDTLAALGPGLTSALAQRQVDDQNLSLSNIFVTVEPGAGLVLTAVEAQLVVDGLNLSYGWAPGPKSAVRQKLASGRTATDVAWSVQIGENNPNTDASLDGSSMVLYECLVVVVGEAEQQLCNDEWGSARRWVVPVGEHQVLLEWLRSSNVEAGGVGMATSGSPRSVPAEPVGDGWFISIGPAGADAWPVGWECLNRQNVRQVFESNPGTGGVWRSSCTGTGEREWQVASTRPGRPSRYVAQ